MKRFGYIIVCLSALLLFSCEREQPGLEPMAMKAIHYQVSVGQEAPTKASLDGSEHYIFQEGDRLYVAATGANADKLYGFLHLISGVGAETAVFDGDLYSHYEFEPSADTELSVTLVGANDRLHTVSNGRITSYSYPSSACTATFADAVQQYSHFTASGHFRDRSFTLAQQSSFLRCNIKYSAASVPDETELTIKILDGSDNELRSASVLANAAGSISWARFVAVFPGGEDLTGAKLSSKQGSADAVTFTPLNSGSSTTLAANTYYNVTRSNLPIWDGFKVTATLDNTAITFNYAVDGDNVFYSKDDGLSWTPYKTSDGSIPLSAGEELCFKGERPAERNYYRNKTGESGSGDNWTINYTPLFSSSGNKLCYISGDMRSLLYGEDFSGKSIPESAFAGCFCKANWIEIESDKTGTLLQAETVGANAFEDMFHGCTTLTHAPDFLHTTSFGEYCCRGMFRKCSNLTSASAFCAEPTTVSKACFQNMFRLCTSLTTISIYLPAAVMSQDCYREMFRGCSNLRSVYSGMLPSTNLAESCYRQLFGNCSNLTNSPDLPATVLATDCYGAMFGFCSSLTSAPSLPAPTLVTNCYSEMFKGCSSLNAITCLATDVSASGCKYNWVYGVKNTTSDRGTFTKASSIDKSTWGTGNSGIPTNWNVVDAPAGD